MISTVEQTYKDGQSSNLKLTYDDGAILYVPKDEANRHYQEILEWVAEGNTITDNGGGE